MAAKEQLHELVDQLPAEEVHAAQRYLEFLRDSKGEFDDEPLSADALEAIRAGQAEIARGESVTLDELKQKYKP